MVDLRADLVCDVPEGFNFTDGTSCDAEAGWCRAAVHLDAARTPTIRRMHVPVSAARPLATPHASAFVDVSGDCRADLVLHTVDPATNEHYLDVFISRYDQSNRAGHAIFDESRVSSQRVPTGTRQVAFADVDSDGLIDVILPICETPTDEYCTRSLVRCRKDALSIHCPKPWLRITWGKWAPPRAPCCIVLCLSILSSSSSSSSSSPLLTIV